MLSSLQFQLLAKSATKAPSSFSELWGVEVPSDNQNLDMIELIARLSCHESDYVLNVVSASSDDHGITNVALKKKVSGDQKKVMDEFINNRLVGKNLALSIIISSEQMSLLLS